MAVSPASQLHNVPIAGIISGPNTHRSCQVQEYGHLVLERDYNAIYNVKRDWSPGVQQSLCRWMWFSDNKFFRDNNLNLAYTWRLYYFTMYNITLDPGTSR